MGPSQAIHDLVYGVMADAESRPERASGDALRRRCEADASDLLLCQLGARGSLAAGAEFARRRNGIVAVPDHHVANVVGLIAKVQMVRSDAQAGIAVMQDVATKWDCPKGHRVREAVCADYSAIQLERAVLDTPEPLSRLRGPQPTRTGAINLAPESARNIRVTSSGHAQMVTQFHGVWRAN